MVFHSLGFALFLPVVFALYWFVFKNKLATQNVLLLVSSYVFYGWWDLRFLAILISLSVANFFIGSRIGNYKIERARKLWLIFGLIINIGVLAVFKYYNFFVDSFIGLAARVGYQLPESTTQIILPVGISFYVFLSLSYILDIYKGKLTAERDIIKVMLSLGFFPIILAGPIQRPVTLIPQIKKPRIFNSAQAIDGLRQILWGLFVKVVIADTLAGVADDVFLNYSDYSGSTLLIGAFLYSIQIYADFAGYSDMAIGVAKLFGFSLMRNFAYPYFARDISEFWKRWHISLTTWFRDYVFYPLSVGVSWRLRSERIFFMKSDLFIYIVASSVTWFLTGLWHGANNTFIVWGMIHGVFLIFYYSQRKPRKRLLKSVGITNDHIAVRIFEYSLTFSIIMMAWIFFRSENTGHAIRYISGIFSGYFFPLPEISSVAAIMLVILFMGLEWIGRKQTYAIEQFAVRWVRSVRWSFYFVLCISVFLSLGKQQTFIYFQF